METNELIQTEGCYLVIRFIYNLLSGVEKQQPGISNAMIVKALEQFLKDHPFYTMYGLKING
jgi:hypothetical protein